MPDSANDHTQGSDTDEPSLARQLLSPTTFPELVADTDALILAEAKKKGVTLRTGFKAMQKAKPDLVERAVRELMPDFVRRLEPVYTDYCNQDENDLAAYLIAHEHQVVDAMLHVADRRAARVHSRTIRSIYDRLRNRAERELGEAMPGIAAVIARHAQTHVMQPHTVGSTRKARQ